MSDELKLLVKKFLLAVKSSVMAMDISVLGDDTLNEVLSTFNALSDENKDSKQEILEKFTVLSSKSTFENGSSLTKEALATALGITTDDVDNIFSGLVLNFAYGTNHQEVLNVAYASPSLVVIGFAGVAGIPQLKIALNTTYTLTVVTTE